MPFYEYSCSGCGEIFEVLQKLGASADGVQCPKCGEKDCKKLMSASTVQGACGHGGNPGGDGCVPRGGFT